MKRRNEKRGLTVLTSSTFPPDNGGKQALVLADLIIPSPPLPWPRAYHHHQYVVRYPGARLPSSLRLRTFFSMLILPIKSHPGRAADCQFGQVTFLATKKPFYPLKPTTPPKNYSWPAHLDSQYLPQLQFLLSTHSTGLMVTSLLKEGPLLFQSSLVALYSESHNKINPRSFSSSSQSLVRCWRDH